MSNREEALRYRANVSAGFSLIMVIITIFLVTFYKNYSHSITRLILVEEYSYLIPVMISVTNTLYLSLRQVGFSYSVRISKIALAVCFTSISLIFYLISSLHLELQIQYMGFSFSWLFLSLIILVYEPSRPVDLIPLASVFLLTPVPTYIIDSFTPLLSKAVGRIAAFATGSVYVESPGFSQIIVETRGGAVSLSIETLCTGIATMSSIISVFPLLLYLAVASPGNTRRKINASLASLSAALFIGFAGNILRVILVVIAIKAMNPDLGLTLFHYSPSIVYASISVLVALVIIRKILGAGAFQFTLPLHARKLSPRTMIASLLLAMILSFSYIGVLKQVEAVSESSPSSVEVVINSMDDFINHPSKYLLNISGVTVVSERYDDFLTRVLGALKVFKVTFSVNASNIYTGYIEIVDTPARLHTWQFCLTLQGFNVVDSWTRTVETGSISFVRVSDGASDYLLSYVLRKIIVRVSGESIPIYFRLSVLTRISTLNAESVEGEAVRLFSSLRITSADNARTSLASLYYATIAFYVTSISVITYFLIIVSPFIIKKWWKTIGD